MFISVKHMSVMFVIIPLVKCKSGNLSDVNNYRAIAISTAMSKILENVIAESVFSFSEIENYQFGFKAEHSTGICSQVFKQIVNYYVNRGSHVFACFIDFKKAFDYVNYLKLFIKLLRDNIDANIVGMLAYWYSRHSSGTVSDGYRPCRNFLWHLMVLAKVVFCLHFYFVVIFVISFKR